VNLFTTHFRKVVFVFAILVSACTSQVPKEKKITVPRINVKKEVKQKVEKVELNYRLIATVDTLDWLKTLDGDSLQTILILNRVDKDHLLRQDSLIVPSYFAKNLDEYCPFPAQLDSLDTLHKMIYVSRYAQIYAVYESGKRIKWGPTSTGKETTQTPNGLFSTNWKSKRNISSVNSSWILNWCFNISNADGVSLHEYDLPGYPASHSCVRLYAEDAEWFYYWADQWILKENLSVKAFGTPVVIFGDYPFHVEKPWRQLAKNNKILLINEDVLIRETEPYLELIISRQNTRKYILEKKTESKSTLPVV
jgi:hypothetical protein